MTIQVQRTSGGVGKASVQFGSVNHPKGSCSITFTGNLTGQIISECQMSDLTVYATTHLNEHMNGNGEVPTLQQIGNDFFTIRLSAIVPR